MNQHSAIMPMCDNAAPRAKGEPFEHLHNEICQMLLCKPLVRKSPSGWRLIASVFHFVVTVQTPSLEGGALNSNARVLAAGLRCCRGPAMLWKFSRSSACGDAGGRGAGRQAQRGAHKFRSAAAPCAAIWQHPVLPVHFELYLGFHVIEFVGSPADRPGIRLVLPRRRAE